MADGLHRGFRSIVAMPLRNLPDPPGHQVVVLAVSPCEADHASLRGIFAHSKWRIHLVRSGREAAQFCRSYPTPVVLCERCLPDGDWKDLLQSLEGTPNRPHLVVASRDIDDRLWAEVLNLGGYDVLPIPFEPSEVFRVISLAWRHWRDERERQPAQHTAAALSAVA
jgi:DNA-binding NtrC family response regulator